MLTGGTAGFAALRDRLEKEVAELAPQMAKVKVRCGSRLVKQCGGSVAFMRGGGPSQHRLAACWQLHKG